MVKSAPANTRRGDTAGPPGREDPLEEEMAATPVFSPGKPMHRGAWRAAVPGGAEPDTTE